MARVFIGLKLPRGHLSLKDGFRVQMALEEEARGRAQPFVWAGLTVLWLFIGIRVFRRSYSIAKTNGVTV
jgi:hypothetical protein